MRVLLGVWLVVAFSMCASGDVGASSVSTWLGQLTSSQLEVRRRAMSKLRSKGSAIWRELMPALAEGRPVKMRLAASFVASSLLQSKRYRANAPWKSLWQAFVRERDADSQRYLIIALSHWSVVPVAFEQRLKRLAVRGRSTGVRAAALRALGERERSLVHWRFVMARRLRARSWRRRRAALQSLARMRKRWRARLRRSKKPMPSALSARSLLPLLRRGLRAKALRVKAAAIIALASLGRGARPLFPALRSYLSHRSWRLRYAAAESFRILGRRARPVMKELAQGLGDGNWGVRYSSSHALARIGAPALPLVEKALRAAKVRVRMTAADTLLRMKRMRPRRGSLYLRLLRVALRDRAAMVRFAAVRGLRRYARVAGLRSFVQATRDRDWRIREVALQSLSRLSLGRRRFRLLRKGLSDRHSAVREAAVIGLAKGSGIGVVKGLSKALADRHSGIRYQAAIGLQRRVLGEEVVATLRGALASGEAIQAAALLALATGGRLGLAALADVRRKMPSMKLVAGVASFLCGKGARRLERLVQADLAKLKVLSVATQVAAMGRLLRFIRHWHRMARTAHRRVAMKRTVAKRLSRILSAMRVAQVKPLRALLARW